MCMCERSFRLFGREKILLTLQLKSIEIAGHSWNIKNRFSLWSDPSVCCRNHHVTCSDAEWSSFTVTMDDSQLHCKTFVSVFLGQTSHPPLVCAWKGEDFAMSPRSWDDKCSSPQCQAAPITNIITQSIFAVLDSLQPWSWWVHDEPPPGRGLCQSICFSVLFPFTQHIFTGSRVFQTNVKSMLNVCHISLWWTSAAPRARVWQSAQFLPDAEISWFHTWRRWFLSQTVHTVSSCWIQTVVFVCVHEL